MYDLIIIGGGTSAMSAVIYAQRKMLKTLVIAKDVGGQTAKAGIVENYPGVPKIVGVELALSLQDQAKSLGAEIKTDIVETINIKKDKTFEVITKKDKYQAKSIIVASGKKPRELKVSGEREFIGKGVAYCATCDAPLFHDKKVVVVGGGNSGLGAASDLRKYGNHVTILEFGDKCIGDAVTLAKLEKDAGISLRCGVEVQKIEGDNFVKSVTVKDKVTGELETLEAQGIFVEIGWEVVSDFLPKEVKTNKNHEIIIDHKTNATSVPGIFAAGDVSDGAYKQAIIAAGSGAIAALSANEYLQKLLK